MDSKKIILEQRNLNLKHYGIDITYEESELSDYKYIVKNTYWSSYEYM